MADMGLGLALGAQALHDALRQRIADNMTARQNELNLSIAKQKQELELRDANDRRAERQQKNADEAHNLKVQQAHDAYEILPQGSRVPASTYAATYQGTPYESGFNPERTLGSTQTGGGLGLPGQASSLAASDSADAGPGGPSDGPAPFVGTLRMAPPNALRTQAAPPTETGWQIGQGTDKMQTAARQQIIYGRLMQNPALTDREKIGLTAKQAGIDMPSSMWDAKAPKPGTLMQNEGGQYQRIADDNTVTPLMRADGTPLHGMLPATPERVGHFVGQDRFDAVTGKPTAGVLNSQTGEWRPTPGQGSLHAPGPEDDPTLPRGVQNYALQLRQKYGSNLQAAENELASAWPSIAQAHPQVDATRTVSALRAMFAAPIGASKMEQFLNGANIGADGGLIRSGPSAGPTAPAPAGRGAVPSGRGGVSGIAPGAVLRLRNGSRVRVLSVNPDGTPNVAPVVGPGQ